MRDPVCVGALIRNDKRQVFVHRRAATRRIFPGIWDIIGGHIESGETPEAALAREINEETGWQLRRIVAKIADWEWEHDGLARREIDYIVKVEGNMAAPRLEAGKHDTYTWVGANNIELMMEGRTDGDHRLCDIVARAVRFDSLEGVVAPGGAPDEQAG